MAVIFVRTLIIYFSLLACMRMMGKRQLGELELNELVVAVLISDMAAIPLQDIGIPLLNGLLPVVTLLCCEYLVSGSIMHSLTLRKLLCGKPSILVENGVVLREAMRKNRFTLDELCEELRSLNVTDISKVQYAILETDGKLNAILYPAERSVSAGQMGLTPEITDYPIIVINDGKLLIQNLHTAGRDERWLLEEIRSRGAQRIRDVFFMTVTRTGQIYYVPMEREKI